ncbi:MAG: HAD family hydrolase [Peptococcaceae bacterium]|nr:HAD family hydrolase [Peptococcaceae bacterium]
MKGLIFDLDGTLLDSMPSWGRQLDDLLTGRGITPPADLLDRTKTLGLENATGMVLEEFGLTDDPAVVYQSFQDDMERLYCSTIPLKPGVREFLDAMHNKGVPMSVATATSRPLVEKALEYHNLTSHFQNITTVAEAGIGKHDPRVFLMATEKLSMQPEECIVFEDSLKAVRSANQAGFSTVAIYEESNLSEQYQLAIESTLYIKDFCNLAVQHANLFEQDNLTDKK